MYSWFGPMEGFRSPICRQCKPEPPICRAGLSWTRTSHSAGNRYRYHQDILEASDVHVAFISVPAYRCICDFMLNEQNSAGAYLGGNRIQICMYFMKLEKPERSKGIYNKILQCSIFSSNRNWMTLNCHLLKCKAGRSNTEGKHIELISRLSLFSYKNWPNIEWNIMINHGVLDYLPIDPTHRDFNEKSWVRNLLPSWLSYCK